MNQPTTQELEQKIAVLEKRIEEAEQANKNNKGWMALLAHDFRGVFANLTWVLDLHESNTIPIEAFKELLPELKQNAQKNLAALDDTFTALKILFERGANAPKEDLTIEALLKSLQTDFNKALQAKNLRLRYRGDSTETVSGNRLVVTSILRKILDNAIKFSYPGAEIIVSAERHDSQTKITVQDFGCGMDDYTLGKLFSMEVVTSRGTEGEVGAGVGLVLVKEALNLINGTIHVESIKEQGTTVQLLI